MIPCPGGCGVDVPSLWDDLGMPIPCRPCQSLQEQARRQATLEAAFVYARIPLHFQGYRLTNTVEHEPDEAIQPYIARVEATCNGVGVTPHNRHVIEAMRQWLALRRPRCSLWLYGPRGTGKTLLLCTLAQHLLDAGEDVLYLSEQDLFGQHSAERHLSELEGGVMHAAKTCGVLLLDGASAAPHRLDPPWPWMVRVMVGLITARYNANLPILCSSSDSIFDYAEVWKYGDGDQETPSGIAGRLFQVCGRRELELVGWDWRTGELYADGG